MLLPLKVAMSGDPDSTPTAGVILHPFAASSVLCLVPQRRHIKVSEMQRPKAALPLGNWAGFLTTARKGARDFGGAKIPPFRRPGPPA